MFRLVALLCLLCTTYKLVLANTYDVSKSGCKGDGKTINTNAIQRIIDRASRDGGGTVYVPTGRFVTGTLQLKSNVTLELSPGAVLLGAAVRSAYPLLKSTERRIAGNYALIFADGQYNIGITGAGSIDGQGDARVFQSGKDDAYERPFLVVLYRCRQVRLEKTTFRNAASWTTHLSDCDQVTVRGLHIWGHANQNNDGLDLDGCHNVTVADCLIDATDDALCLKAQNRACQYITVTNCVLSTHSNAIKFGTVSNGGFKHISISNIIVRPSEAKTFNSPFGLREGITGIALESVDGGTLENVLIQQIMMDSIHVPIFLKIGDRGRRSLAQVAQLRNIRLQNITAYHAGITSSSITGMPGRLVENVVLKDIYISCKGGGTVADANVTSVGENTSGYPDPRWFGGNLPSYGLYVRHAKGLTLDNVQFVLEGTDARPAVLLDDVSDSSLERVVAPAGQAGQPGVKSQNVRQVRGL
ncbi:glycoside hydrolase family 28 protein [Fibrella aquatilis]|uniref:Glycoside hydrolase n=1 Tax=Fibrella aquatilis TaxID=2817059 RepID=A0A939G432_9BACT|nr:glycosyl hydrolase family 28 protein [Fibrella aquatilis]MBO0931992.1 glycoside hydrolase [Fibrella aquatilis]